MLMVELLTCSFPRKYHSDLNNLCNYIFITYFLCSFSAPTQTSHSAGGNSRKLPVVVQRRAVFILILGTHLSEGVFVALFSPRQTTEGGVTSGQYRSMTLAVLGPPFILCGTKSTHFLSVLQHSVKL